MTNETAYCVKCAKKVKPQKATRIKLKNGRHALEGTCPRCGTKVFKFVKG